MSENCGNCRFWMSLFAEAPGQGLCRRYPSGVLRTAGFWCGEWRAKEPEKPKEREPGYYWIKCVGDYPWEIDQWMPDGHWRVNGPEDEYEIDERRIERSPA